MIGGGPAAAVVFTREVRARASAHPRIRALQEELRRSPGAEARGRLEAALREVTLAVQAEVAGEFDAIHTVERARDVGSLREIVEPAALRPFVVRSLRPRATLIRSPGASMKRNRKQSFRSFGRGARGPRPVRAEVQGPEEIAAMRAAGHLAGLILDEVAGFVQARCHDRAPSTGWWTRSPATTAPRARPSATAGRRSRATAAPR